MAASNSSNVPQGFSIYQPVLGAQLQFFPAVGTQELDQLLHAFIPGSASIQEKRASVALDFFEHLEVTGESFKFYPVYFMTTPVESPVTASPAQESGYASCFNESPVMSNWDWSQISQATSQSSNSRRRQTSKASVSRHQTAADFSHLPGMKIMTKDGQDVTNSASRGSKTKEQRDHAHLMRIIKACDSCRKKKVRCDPSHKKRSVAQAQSQSAQKSAAKKSKTKAVPQAQVANPVIVDNDFTTSLAPFELDPSFALTDLSSVSPAEPTYESWEDFIQFPANNNTGDYDFLADPEGLFSSPESLTMSASSKPDTPVSQQYQPGAVGLPNPQPDLASSRLPYDQTESIHDYVDFNLYSPASSCSSLSASSPKPSIPQHRQENPGSDELFSSCDFSLLTPSSEQVQHATSFVGSGLSSIEGAFAFSETPFDAAISRQNYYAGTDTTNLDDYSVEVDVNHNVDQSGVGDDHNADSGTADTGESWYNDSSSAVIATTAIATSAIATVATIANADVNANDLQPTLAERATRDEQQDSSRLNRRHGYSELIIGGVRRSRIESIDEGGTIATAIATPAIEALPQESTPTAEIATPALETYQQESSPAEIAASTGTALSSPTTYHAPSGTLQPYDASSVILATSHTGTETNNVSQHIHPSLTDTATLRTTSLLLTSMLVSAYASGDMSVDSWKSATIMAMLLCAVLYICSYLTHLGYRGQFYKRFFGRNEKQHAEKNDLVGLQCQWQALRCQASAATRSVGQIMSRAGTSIAV